VNKIHKDEGMKQYLDFSLEEYRNRLINAQRLMAEHQLDFLLLSQAENLIYLTG
jgi:Xaa-Pro aminopeptidase